MSRAQRRADYERRKKAERAKHPCCPTDRQVGIHANTRTRCSKVCCRNPEPISTRKARGLRQ